MFASTNKFSKEIAPPQPGIFNRKHPLTPPISMITFFNLLSFPALAGCLSAIFFLFSCQRSTEPLIIPAALQLEAEGVTCTEVWLRIKGEDEYYGKTLRLYRSDSLVIDRKWTRKDALLLDEDLEPSTNYSYVAKIVDDKNLLGQSAVISITTMDTTSHDFQWKVFTFGNGGSSYLNDVAIISPDDIWCVGKINASGGPYNAAHWDGERWELRRILFKYFCDQPGTFPAPAKSVLALDHDEVFITSGSQIAHWNGIKQDGLDCIPISVNKLWGTNKNNIYAVGVLGAIAHYNGVSWRRIESPVDVNINDIYGYEIQSTGESIILCAAGDVYKKDQAYIIKINDDYSTELFTWNISDPISSLWIANSFRFYACGNGIWIKQFEDWNWTNPGSTFSRRIRGTGINDIFVTGDYAHILHFNGKSWQDYQFLYSGIFEGLDVSHDVVVACGSDGRKAYIIMAER